MIAVSTTASRQLGATVRAYFFLTKPRIIELLLVATLPTMVLAANGLPPPLLVVATMIGGAISAGGANSINSYVDRDIDRMMYRTRSRPLPNGTIVPERALAFGATLATLSFVGMALLISLLAAVLTLAGFLFYVFVYTMWLKRATPQNIVIGGAAGAAPPLVAWAAVTGGVGWPAVVLFLIIFFWTPPHFWALALRFKEDYARASVPMLPVLAGERETRKQILVYAIILFPVSLLLLATGAVGIVYALAAVALGVAFVWKAYRLWQSPSPKKAYQLFKFSNVYLTLLFGSLILDVAVGRVAGAVL